MRVVVADDSLLTREGIVRLLRDAGIDVVAEAGDAETLLGHVRSARPDVAIVDIRMPPTHTDEGLVAVRTIRTEHPDVGARPARPDSRAGAGRTERPDRVTGHQHPHGSTLGRACH